MTPEEFNLQFDLMFQGRRGPITRDELGDLPLSWVEERKAPALAKKLAKKQR